MTRRTLLRGAAISAAAAAASALPAAARASSSTRAPSSSFAPILEPPATVTVFIEGRQGSRLQRSGDRWQIGACSLTVHREPDRTEFSLAAPGPAVERIHVRWRMPLPADKMRVLGDAWERSYGDLGWREVAPERPMPWYFLSHDGERTHGYGVLTGASAFAFWQCDRDGVSLWLDVRSGGKGVLLGDRVLPMATVIAREGADGETSMTAARALCVQMCPHPRPAGVIYGSNDWYYAYGNSSAADILRDADLVAELAPADGPRPFAVADEGWANPKTFPDLPGLAAGIRRKFVRPGIWIRPLKAPKTADPALLLPVSRFANRSEGEQNPAYDPTVPEALHRTLGSVREVRSWGFELIKHDFSTYDLLGQWGFAMGPSPALPGWSFHDRSRTSAEVIKDFYQAIRREAGESVVLGCNTMGQLAAGLFEAQRIGDDVSGKDWERTRRMGVNTLGFRIDQNRTFFRADPDCVPLTPRISWSLTRQWLEAVARSGAVLMISAVRGSVGGEQKAALREAFAVAAGQPGAIPLDWLATPTPHRWSVPGPGHDAQYHWLEPNGASPFKV